MKDYNTVYQLLILQKALSKIYVAKAYLLTWKDFHNIQLEGEASYKQYLQIILF